MNWDLVETNSKKKEIEVEYADILNDKNSAGKIDYDVYSELFDVGIDLLDDMYEQGRKDAITHAHWMETKWTNVRKCSFCGKCVTCNFELYWFCPNCGSSMDEKVD